LKRLDINSAMQRLAEHRIEQAIRQGKFDNLRGAGQPVDLDDMPADENARMVWWALRLMRGSEAKSKPAQPPIVGVARCTNSLCGNRNPPSARYCRRCGVRVVV
jgi:Domain of unknown function (DUF1992)